ncbi:MAG: translocation/assembly module TamB domain-containing protein [Gallionella sp.]|nr:translocation/assembly module TamB domain-containing protein [Gallionella sp.]
MGTLLKTVARRKWMVLLLSVFLVIAGAGAWLFASASGLRWLVNMAEHQSAGRFDATDVSGTLLDTINLQQMVLRGNGWRVTAHEMQIEWQPAALLQGELRIDALHAGRIEILSLPSGKSPALPENLGLPFTVSVLDMKAGSLSLSSREGAKPAFVAKDVEARYTGGAKLHRLQLLRIQLPYGVFSGSGEISTAKPYALNAQAALETEMELAGRKHPMRFSAKALGDLQHVAVSLDAKAAAGSVNGSAQIEPFSKVPVSRLKLSFSGINPGQLFNGAPPALVSGNADLHGTQDGVLEGSLRLRNTVVAALDQNGLPVRGITAQVRLSASRWQLQQLDAHLLDHGHLTGTISWERLSGKLGAQLKVRDLDAAAFYTHLPVTSFQGDITLDNQHAIMALRDGESDIHGELDLHRDVINLSSLRVTRGETELSGNGQLALDRRRTFRFSSRLRRLNLSQLADTSATNLNARLEISGSLAPRATGTLQFDMTNSRYGKYDINGHGRLEFSGIDSAKGNLALNIGDNHLDMDLVHGSQSSRVKLTIDAANLAQIGNGWNGQLAGNAELSGSIANPRLQFTARAKDLSLPGGQRFATLDGSGDLAASSMQMNLGITGFRGSGTINVPQASLELKGSRAHHSLLASARIEQEQERSGEVTLKMDGGLSDPSQGWKSLQWRGKIDELSAQGMLPFRLLREVPLTLARNSIELGTADADFAGGQIQLSGLQWTPQHWHTAGHFNGLNVRAVNMQSLKSGPDQPAYAQAFDTIRIGGAWDVAADAHLHGQFEVHRESGDWVVNPESGKQLGLSDLQLSVSAEQDKLHLQLIAKGTHLGDIKAQASMPITHSPTGWTIPSDSPLTGHLHLVSDDLSWIGPIVDSNLQSGGRLKLDADLIGTPGNPRLRGEAEGSSLSLAFLNQGVRLEQGELKARFEPDAVHVDRLVFSAPYQPAPGDKLFSGYSLPAGNGRISASGRIDLVGDNSDLLITADHLPLAQRTDRWILVSGSGHARYASKTLLLDGNIRANAGLINQPVSDRPVLSDDVQIIGKEAPGRPGPPTRVNATLDLGDHFYIRAAGFEGRLAGNLAMHGEPGELMHVTGSIAAQDAVFDAYGQRLQVERGIINFQGPLDDPGLNILALRKGLAVEAGVEVTGTVRHPLVRLVSTPDVPDAEKLSWIVLGRVPDTSGVDSSLLIAAAGSILGGQSSSQLGKTLGIDQFSLSQQTGADSQQVQKVTVGKQLSSRARISYEQSLNEAGSVTIFSYTLTPRITIVTRTGTEDAFDLLYTFRFY